MLEIRTSKFRKDIKKMQRRKKDMSKFKEFVEIFYRGEPLPAHYRDHILSGEYTGCRECHLEPD